MQDGEKRPVQTQVTSRWEDGSVRWLHVCFQADFRANRAQDCFLASGKEAEPYPAGRVQTLESGKDTVASHGFSAVLSPEGSDVLLKQVVFREKELPYRFPCPQLRERTREGIRTYRSRVVSWKRIWEGPLAASYECLLDLEPENGKKHLKAEAVLHFWGGKPWMELEYRLINTSDEPLDIASLCWKISESRENTGAESEPDKVRTMTGISNYRTSFQVSETGEQVSVLADADLVMNTANEHFAEVFFGTLF